MNTERTRYTKMLPVVLTQDDKNELSDELVTHLNVLHGLKVERSQVARDFKKKMDEQECEISNIATWLQDGARPRVVDVEEYYDPVTHQMTVARMDTGEILEARDPTPRERQMTIQGADEKKIVDPDLGELRQVRGKKNGGNLADKLKGKISPEKLRQIQEAAASAVGVVGAGAERYERDEEEEEFLDL